MSGFDDREKAFENKFAHDENLRFKVEARTSKLFGEWAAGKMGLTGDKAKQYGQEVVGANLEESGFDDILRKVRTDFAKHNIEMSDHTLQSELDDIHTEARNQVMNETK